MNNAEIIKGIDATIAGLEIIKNALTTEGSAPAKATKSVETAKADVPTMNPPTDEAPAMVGKFSVEQLQSMKYNDFKKLASSLGVKCTGTRDEIMERILALDVTITKDGAEVSEPVEDEAPTKSGKPARGKKVGAKKTDEPTRDEFDEQAEEIAKETAVEDIIEALKDVEIKATKKNAVTLLAQALRDGLIELDDEDEDEDADADEEDVEDVADDEEEEDDDDADDSEDEEEISADSYFPQFDPQGYNDPDEMTEERAEAIEAKMDEILTDISDGTISQEDIESYLEDNATQEELDLLGDDYTEEDLIKLYMELIKRTIDNDGEEHEPSDPYEVGEKNVCCGHELKYVKKTKMYVCSHCGSEYEAED